jgi:hypothetical protein
MAVTIDIFNPQVSTIAKGLEGKTIMIYGGNNVGKTYVAARLSKPYFIACESGLNAQDGVKYNRVTRWSDFRKIVKQFTDRSTVDKARSLYDTIVIDEVYASSIMCQDYVMATYGDGALTLSDGDGKHNLYQLYEKEYFRMINLLLSCDYTVVFIGHEQEKNGFVTPKGDKRCLGPILDNCDFVVYVKANGVDEKGQLIKSSGYMVQTKEFFARSRFEHCPPVIKEFSAENLESAINEAIENEEKLNNATVVTYAEQKAQNTSEVEDYDEVMNEIQAIGMKFVDAGLQNILTEIVEDTLGKGGKVAACSKRQIEALIIIRDNLREKAVEVNLK